MIEEYVEIVHAAYDSLDSFSLESNSARIKAQRIKQLYDEGKGHFYGDMSFTKPINLPKIPLDTPIRLGGYSYDVCVLMRKEAYECAGFTQVSADENISFTREDIL